MTSINQRLIKTFFSNRARRIHWCCSVVDELKELGAAIAVNYPDAIQQEVEEVKSKKK